MSQDSPQQRRRPAELDRDDALLASLGYKQGMPQHRLLTLPIWLP